jgi:hypothetical protein
MASLGDQGRPLLAGGTVATILQLVVSLLAQNNTGLAGLSNILGPAASGIGGLVFAVLARGLGNGPAAGGGAIAGGAGGLLGTLLGGLLGGGGVPDLGGLGGDTVTGGIGGVVGGLIGNLLAKR